MEITIRRVILAYLLVIVCSAQAKPDERDVTYHLACIRMDEPVGVDMSAQQLMEAPERVRVFHLDDNLNIVKVTDLPCKYRTLDIASDGKILSYTWRRLGDRRTFVTEMYLSKPVGRTLAELFRGPAQSNSLIEQASAEMSIEYNTAALKMKSLRFVKERGLVTWPLDERRADIFLLGCPIGGGVEASPRIAAPALSNLRGKAVINLYMEDPEFEPGGKYSDPFQSKYSSTFNILLLYDFREGTFQHICGSSDHRFFFDHEIDVFDGRKVLFYRIENFSSIRSSSSWDTPVVAVEGGWQVCMFDLAADSLEVLTDKGHRFEVGPGGGIRWSPDGTRFLFVRTRERFYVDKTNTECPGVYVYDLEGRTYLRSTDKFSREEPLCWAPDSDRYLVERSYLQVEGRPQGEAGYFVVDTLTDAEYRLNLPGYAFRRSLTWSPDGNYIAFSAKFKEDGSKCNGLFVMPDDQSGKYVLIDKVSIDGSIHPEPEFFFSPTWLDY